MMHNPSPSNFNNMAASPYGVPSPASSVGSSIFDMNITSPESYASSPASNQPRQRLRPWLTDQINEGKTPGLEWVDKVQMIFKIPWKHFGRPGVDEYNDAMLFRFVLFAFICQAMLTEKYCRGSSILLISAYSLLKLPQKIWWQSCVPHILVIITKLAKEFFMYIFFLLID